MKEHHKQALEKAKVRLIENTKDLLVILLGGSIAKGIERDDSDVDLIVIISDDEYKRRIRDNEVSFFWNDICNYPNGYVEGRFVSCSFIIEAAERGSEPTRHSFTGVYAVYSTNKELEETIKKIPVYPSHEKQKKYDSFFAQFQLNRYFFWDEGVRRNDPYLKAHAAHEIVLFGCRLILAYNEILFPCQKRLLEATMKAPKKPEELDKKIERVFNEMSQEAKEDFCRSIESFNSWSSAEQISRFQLDVEMAWFTGTNAVGEW